MTKYLITGGAGFIGSHLIDHLIKTDCQILCLDNFDDFYDPREKYENIEQHKNNNRFIVENADITNLEKTKTLVGSFKPHAVVHLAARAGVRPSIENPHLYIENNVTGTLNLLEAIKNTNLKRFVFGSSSSVYGENQKVPFAEDDALKSIISPYASSKLAAEALCHCYSKVYHINMVVLRFFTVYGPRQRPDLAIRKFMHRIKENKAIDIYGDGTSSRDYTFVEDVVDGIVKSLNYQGNTFELFNIGNSSPIKLIDLIAEIENIMGVKSIINKQSNQPGDVSKTFADISRAKEKLGYNPSTKLHEGLLKMSQWINDLKK